MSKKYDVQTYILHWAHRTKNGIVRPYNDLLLNCINSIKRAEISGVNKTNIDINNQVNIIYDCDQESFDDLVKRIDRFNFNSGKVNLIKDYKKKGASGARNIAIENAIKSQNNGKNKDGLFVILDNDMKVGNGWIANLVGELIHAEKYFGTGCAISYDQMPYLEEGLIKAGDSSNGPCYKNIMKLGDFIDYCKMFDIPVNGYGNVSCREVWDSGKGKIKVGGTGLTYSGWRLSNFIASTRFVREGGGFSSEELSGFGREDLEWAVRVFKTRCIMLESHTVFVQHLMAFTSSFTCGDRVNNEPILRRLLGDEVIAGFHTGETWAKLRQEQMAKYGYK